MKTEIHIPETDLLNELPVCTVILEPDFPHRVIHANAETTKISGYSLAQFTGSDSFFIDKTHEDDRESLISFLGDRRVANAESIKIRFNFSNNNHHWINFRVVNRSRTEDDQGYLMGIFFDISLDEAATEILKKREEIFRVASWCSNDLIYEKNIETGKMLWYADIDKALGYEYGEFPRTIEAWKNSLHPNDVDKVNKAIESHIKDPSTPCHQEYLIRTRDGKFRIWLDNAQLITKNDVTTNRIIGSCTDITQSKQEYLQIQKMETVGRLAGGIAHDFNNLLTAIIGFSDMALGEIQPDHECHTYITEIRKAGELASNLTRQLLAFSRKQVFNLQNIHLNEVVLSTEKLIKRLLGEKVMIELDLAPDLMDVHVDSSQIQQVIMNLAVNANDAMPNGGVITMKSCNLDLDADSDMVTQNPEILPAMYVSLSITDTGSGISEEHLASIFEPFYTTKGKGKGTGLGLATVYGIIKQSMGYIYAKSKLDEGTTFTIYLPAVASDTDRKQEAVSQTKNHNQGHERILITEDEPVVRTLAKTALAKKGYDVLLAKDGEEAVKLYTENKDRIDLLLTDVIMPGMNGVELANQLKALSPELKVIFMSGYTDNIVADYKEKIDDTNFIEKPFNTDDLVAIVRSMLDSPGH